MHCYNYWRERKISTKKNNDLSRIQIKKLVSKIKRDTPLEQVTLSGGEPMLRKDISYIVSDFNEMGLNSVVITNGTLLTENNLQKFPSGTLFEVTLFSADSQVHNQIAGNKVFEKILVGLSCLRKKKHKFVLAIVITKNNAYDVRRTIELGIALGAEGILLNRVNLSRRAFPFVKELVPPVNLLHQSLFEANQAAQHYGVSISVSVPIPPCLIDPSEFSYLHFGWCPRGNKDAYYTVGPTGELRPCNHSSIILGSLFNKGFAELVQGPTAQKFWTTIPKICSECHYALKKFCRGGCPAAAYECYGSAEHIDPFVEMARRALA
jgi:radical SAM protein with 4Fe4S-binding SPASM domain